MIGAMIGAMILRQRVNHPAPSRLAASRISCGMELMPAVSTIAVNGRLRQTFTTMIEIIAYCSSPSQFGPPSIGKNPSCAPTQFTTL